MGSHPSMRQADQCTCGSHLDKPQQLLTGQTDKLKRGHMRSKPRQKEKQKITLSPKLLGTQPASLQSIEDILCLPPPPPPPSNSSLSSLSNSASRYGNPPSPPAPSYFASARDTGVPLLPKPPIVCSQPRPRPRFFVPATNPARSGSRHTRKPFRNGTRIVVRGGAVRRRRRRPPGIFG